MLRPGQRSPIARAQTDRRPDQPGSRRRLAGPLAATLLALLSLSIWASPAYAGCLARPGAPGVTVFSCDADEVVTFTASGGLLRHNRTAAGDPGFADEFDFDNRTVAAAAGSQHVANAFASRVEVFGTISNNHLTIGDAGSPASTIQVAFDLKNFGDGNDQLTIDDSANATTALSVSVTATGVTSSNRATTALTGVVTYGGSGVDALTIRAGGGDEVISVSSTDAPMATTIDAGAGDDTIIVGNDLTLDNIRGPLTVEGGAGSSDTLRASDRNETAANAYTLTATTLQRVGAATVTINGGIEQATLTAGSGDDTITVDDLPPGASLGVTLNAGAGNDRIIWDEVATSAPVATVELGAGTDTFQFNGRATGSNNVTVLDCTGRLTFGQSCTASSNRVSIGAVEQAVINGGSVQDDIHVTATAGLALTVNARDGNDRLSILGAGPGSTVAIDAGPGDETLFVGSPAAGNAPGSALAIQGAVSVDGGLGTNRMSVSRGFGPPVPVPPAGAATVTVTPINVGAAAGDNYFGPGGSLTYAGFQSLSVSGYDVNDTVRVIPSATTELSVFGNLQTTEDTLDVDLTGTTGATLDLEASPNELRFADRRTVRFLGFENKLANGQPIAGLIELGAASFGAAENGGPATITVTRSSPVGAASVQLATSDGTATGGLDYAPLTATVQFAPGETSKTVTIAVLGDSLVENDETVNLTLSSAVGLVGEAALGPRTTAVLLIDDSGVGDDRQQTPPPGQPPPGQTPPGQQPGTAPAPPVVSIDDARMAEGNARAASLLFTVRLSAPAARPVTVDFATTDLTARSVRVRGAGPDYLARRGRLTIPAGRTGGAIAVPVLGDTQGEADERFRVTLRNPTGATLGRATAFGQILDDDARPARLFVNDVSVVEGGAGRTVLRFDVRLTRPAAGPVRFVFATADLTARARTDYVAVRGGLTIPAGQVGRTVAVAVLGDRAVEPGEQLRLVLSRITGAAVLDPIGVGTILNDDR